MLLEAAKIMQELEQDPRELSYIKADLYHRTGEWDKADSCYHQSLLYWEKILGKNNRAYASMLTNYAVFKFSTHNPAQANQLFIESGEFLFKDAENNFLYLSDKERANYLKFLDANFELYSSFIFKFNEVVKGSLDNYYNLKLKINNFLLRSNVGFKKSIIYEQDPENTNKYFEWKSVKTRILFEYSKPVNKRSTELESWESEANELEKLLVKNSVK
jgi:hypothetical protein